MKKFLINEVEVVEQDFWSRLDDDIMSEVEDTFEDMLSDSYGDIELLGINYSYGEVLKSVDYVAYQQAMVDYADSINSNAQSEVDSTEGFTVNNNLYRVEEEGE